jgi:hypothetical protein
MSEMWKKQQPWGEILLYMSIPVPKNQHSETAATENVTNSQQGSYTTRPTASKNHTFRKACGDINGCNQFKKLLDKGFK